MGAGVFYGAAVSEARALEGEEVYVVGGANSAGQAAMYLSRYASKDHACGARRPSRGKHVRLPDQRAPSRCERSGSTEHQGRGRRGRGRLEHLILENSASGHTETVAAAALFVLIGAEPSNDWLPEEIERDEKGFVFTGRDLPSYGLPRRTWHLGRLPMPLETSMPGVFAVGDVRYGSVKRVASAVGEGSIAIQLVHEYLAQSGLWKD